ncbi:MAG TPA: hypothetical protein VHW74_11815 [Mycobacteriales bacterium]|nr:hypothetical protein [Mycobacteriales bacterium]
MRARLAAIAAVTLAGFAFAAPAAAAGAHGGVLQLSGVLHLQKGSCVGGKPSGSYLSVTFGSKAISNPSSDCEGGAVTLLSPGRDGLSTTSFSPSSDEAFDGHGDAVARSIAQPASFGRHTLGIVSASQDLQDAPTSPGLFSLPHIYVTGHQVLADVRSIQVLYDGHADTTCASGAGAGCWLVGAERATGTYDASTHRITLTWFSGQSFVPQSAGTAVHLSGVFVGAKPKPLTKTSVVELGTSSFAAASPPPEVAAAIRQGTARRHRSASLSASPNGSAAASEAAVVSPEDSPLWQVLGAPLAISAAVLLIGIDALGFSVALGRRRRS